MTVNTRSRIDPETIAHARRAIALAGEISGTSAILIGSRLRHAPIVYGRQLAMTVIRDELRLSYPKIGRLMNRHHSTVIHDVEALRARLLLEAKVRHDLDRIRTRLWLVDTPGRVDHPL